MIILILITFQSPDDSTATEITSYPGMLTERGNLSVLLSHKGSPGTRNKPPMSTQTDNSNKPRMRKKGPQSSGDLTRSVLLADVQLKPCVAFSAKSSYNKKNPFLWVWWQVHNVMLR